MALSLEQRTKLVEAHQHLAEDGRVVCPSCHIRVYPHRVRSLHSEDEISICPACDGWF